NRYSSLCRTTRPAISLSGNFRHNRPISARFPSLLNLRPTITICQSSRDARRVPRLRRPWPDDRIVLTMGGETRIKRNRALLELWLSTDLARSEPVAELL